ncbi:MAG: hypothetical protein OHK0057_07560 [Thermoflexibacter sp.]
MPKREYGALPFCADRVSDKKLIKMKIERILNIFDVFSDIDEHNILIESETIFNFNLDYTVKFDLSLKTINLSLSVYW